MEFAKKKILDGIGNLFLKHHRSTNEANEAAEEQKDEEEANQF